MWETSEICFLSQNKITEKILIYFFEIFASKIQSRKMTMSGVLMHYFVLRAGPSFDHLLRLDFGSPKKKCLRKIFSMILFCDKNPISDVSHTFFFLTPTIQFTEGSFFKEWVLKLLPRYHPYNPYEFHHQPRSLVLSYHPNHPITLPNPPPGGARSGLVTPRPPSHLTRLVKCEGGASSKFAAT